MAACQSAFEQAELDATMWCAYEIVVKNGSVTLCANAWQYTDGRVPIIGDGSRTLRCLQIIHGQPAASSITTLARFTHTHTPLSVAAAHLFRAAQDSFTGGGLTDACAALLSHGATVMFVVADIRHGCTHAVTHLHDTLSITSVSLSSLTSREFTGGSSTHAPAAARAPEVWTLATACGIPAAQCHCCILPLCLNNNTASTIVIAPKDVVTMDSILRGHSVVYQQLSGSVPFEQYLLFDTDALKLSVVVGIGPDPAHLYNHSSCVSRDTCATSDDNLEYTVHAECSWKVDTPRDLFHGLLGKRIIPANRPFSDDAIRFAHFLMEPRADSHMPDGSIMAVIREGFVDHYHTQLHNLQNNTHALLVWREQLHRPRAHLSLACTHAATTPGPTPHGVYSVHAFDARTARFAPDGDVMDTRLLECVALAQCIASPRTLGAAKATEVNPLLRKFVRDTLPATLARYKSTRDAVVCCHGTRHGHSQEALFLSMIALTVAHRTAPTCCPGDIDSVDTEKTNCMRAYIVYFLLVACCKFRAAFLFNGVDALVCVYDKGTGTPRVIDTAFTHTEAASAVHFLYKAFSAGHFVLGDT